MNSTCIAEHDISRTCERGKHGCGVRHEDVTISAVDLRHLLNDRDHLTRQVTELQTRMSEMVSNSLPRRVRAFHTRFGHPIRHTPTIPSDDEVRFRASLIAEEFFEFLDACFDTSTMPDVQEAIAKVKAAINGPYPYQRAPVRVDLPEAMDALTDLDWVSEGTRAVFGVDGAPILAEVARANSEKDPVYVRVKDAYHHGGAGGGDEWDEIPDPTAKPTKPAGWRGPDVFGCLIAQGWTGPRPAASDAPQPVPDAKRDCGPDHGPGNRAHEAGGAIGQPESAPGRANGSGTDAEGSGGESASAGILGAGIGIGIEAQPCGEERG